MNLLKAKKLSISGDNINVATTFRKFDLNKKDVTSIRVFRISSLFDEIGIELETFDRKYIITERVVGFFDLAKLFHFEDLFGALWYRDAEDGRELRHAFGIGA